jgi:cob(I)alamin adenosyltransferase
MKIYTRTGDNGTTGLLYGGRVPKDSDLPTAYGSVDEAQAFIGLARAEAAGTELDGILLGLGRDLYVVMAELATLPANRHKLTDEVSRTSKAMVDALEPLIDDITGRFAMPTEFVVPGGSRTGALLDVARTVVRRAERATLAAAHEGSFALMYLNRLSDLLWALARWQDGASDLAKSSAPAAHRADSEPPKGTP